MSLAEVVGVDVSLDEQPVKTAVPPSAKTAAMVTAALRREIVRILPHFRLGAKPLATVKPTPG